MQVPVQAELQQTLLTQNPESQSEFIPSGRRRRSGILPQLHVDAGVAGGACVVAVQVVRQAAVPQV